MLRRCALFFLFVALACGGQKTEADKTDTKGATSSEPASAPAQTKSTAELLQRVWAPSGAEANNENSRTLLSFHPDGTYGYHVFNGKGWDNTPGTYKLDGDTLTDNENQTYKVSVTENSLTLDNVEEGKADFINWHPATVEDWDPVEKKAPNPVEAAAK